MALADKIIDRKFVVTAVIIGVAYSFIIFMIAKINRDMAGVAGAALTLLATGIFKAFETLRFRAVAESERQDVIVRPTNVFRVFYIGFAAIGVQMLAGIVVASLGLIDLTSILTLVGEGEVTVEHVRIILILTIAASMAYFVIGYVTAKAFVTIRYSTIGFGLVLSLFLNLLPVILGLGVWEAIQSVPTWAIATWLFYFGAGVLGARIARPAFPIETQQGSRSIAPTDAVHT